MNEFLAKIVGLMNYLFVGPVSNEQQLMVYALGWLSGLLLFSRMSSATGRGVRSGPGLVFFVYMLGLAIAIAGIALADDYLVGGMVPIGRTTGALLALVVISAVVVVPVICLFRKCNYVVGSLSWFSSVSTGVFIMMIGCVGMEMAAAGGKSADNVQQRKVQVQNLIRGAH